MPLNMTNCTWQYESTTNTQSPIIRLELPHCIIRIQYTDYAKQTKYHTEIIFCPPDYNMKWDTCMITDDNTYKSLQDAKLRALEILNNYIMETKTAINQYLKNSITGDI